MCGFAGIFLFENFNQNEFEKMTNKLNFRGPDEFGQFINLNDKIAFFHHRLSILDLSVSGKQPMESHSGRFIIAYNGEIYNHLNIRNELTNIKNIKWKGTSDTETLINSIEIYGIDRALNLCKGVFAFALWDKKEKKLILARDKLGEKPLYYGFNKNIFYFGSDLSPLKNNQLFNTQLDLNALKMYFNLNYIPAPHSIYKNIKKLESSSYVEISDKNRKLQIKKYWKLKNNNTNKIENKIEYFKKKIENSVQLQTISDVPIGSFLSGGIDSSLVSYFMQKNSMKKIKTFNISFDDANYDEGSYAHKISQFIGTDHQTHRLSKNSFQEVLSNLNTIYAEPFSDSSQIVTYLISKYAKKDVSVVLSGDGGDEGFAGYNRHLIANKINTFNNIIPIHIRKILFNYLEKNNYKNLERFINLLKKTDRKSVV